MYNDILSIVLSTARLRYSPAADSSKFVLNDTILEDILGLFPPDTDVQNDIQRAMAEEEASAEDILMHIVSASQALEAVPFTHSTQQLLHRIRLLSTLRDLVSRATNARATFTFDTLELLRAVRILAIDGPPYTLFVGPANNTGQVTNVKVPGSSYPAQHLSIEYRGSDSFPYIRLTTPSTIQHDDRPQMRAEWAQKPYAAYDLELYTYRDRLIGRVCTRMLVECPEANDQGVLLRFSADLPLYYTCTKVFVYYDESEHILARIIKVNE